MIDIVRNHFFKKSQSFSLKKISPPPFFKHSIQGRSFNSNLQCHQSHPSKSEQLLKIILHNCFSQSTSCCAKQCNWQSEQPRWADSPPPFMQSDWQLPAGKREGPSRLHMETVHCQLDFCRHAQRKVVCFTGSFWCLKMLGMYGRIGHAIKRLLFF